MTSPQQRDANRRNARRSTGPRTVVGKAAARLNARRHGLAVPLRSEPGADHEIERLAGAIAGARLDLMDLARRIAEAELELRRIRRARLLLAKFPRPPTFLPKMVESPDSKLFNYAVRRLNRRKEASFEDLGQLLREMGWDPAAPLWIKVPSKRRLPNWASAFEGYEGYERYERRALSRRKFAIRDFDAARLATPD